jgi:demethylmenaquinone methyltransferase / 2-methoxy-6-polyprenyl-1,4-benzoquinol methylase
MSEAIRKMFSRISGKYDRMNHLLSFGFDRSWRREAAKEAMMENSEYRLLDLSTGTGDLAIAIQKEAMIRGKHIDIVATDFSHEMLKIAKEKAKDEGFDNILFKVGDSLNTGYRDESFEVVTSAFSLRNYDDVGAFIFEAHRILEIGGKLVILDMATPDGILQRIFFMAYLPVMRLIGMFVDNEAYSWLPSSINDFDKKDLIAKIKGRGFRNVKYRQLSSGIAYLVVGEK